MIEVRVYNTGGEEAGAIQVDEAWFGGKVKMEILRLAVTRHESNQRQGSVATKSRGLVEGSKRKIFAQKHTGRARAVITAARCRARCAGRPWIPPSWPACWTPNWSSWTA
jgi:ribosomal protein L4